MCGKEFVPHPNHLNQERCSKPCSDKASKKRKKEYFKEKKLSIKKDSSGKKILVETNTSRKKISTRKKNSDKIEEEVAVEKSLNGLGDGLKAIEIYKKLHQDLCRLMRKNRIAKYNPDIQNIILELMQASYRHLNNELNKKEVIIVDGQEE